MKPTGHCQTPLSMNWHPREGKTKHPNVNTKSEFHSTPLLHSNLL